MLFFHILPWPVAVCLILLSTEFSGSQVVLCCPGHSVTYQRHLHFSGHVNDSSLLFLFCRQSRRRQQFCISKGRRKAWFLFIFFIYDCGDREGRTWLPSLVTGHIMFHFSSSIRHQDYLLSLCFTCGDFYGCPIVTWRLCKYSVMHKSQKGKEKKPTHSETVYWTLFFN